MLAVAECNVGIQVGFVGACMRLARGGVGDVCVLRWVSVVWFVGCVLQKDGRTPLFDASLSGRAEAVRALLDAGAAVNQASVSRTYVCSRDSRSVGGCRVCDVGIQVGFCGSVYETCVGRRW